MELTIDEKEIIGNALVEYEEKHYEDRSQKWQEVINKLIDKFKQ